MRRAWPLLLATALCARAAAPARVAAPAYPAPVAAWGGVAGAAFALPGAASLSPALARADFSSPEVLRALSPVVVQLEKALALSPQAFAALPAADRVTTLELAVEAAREDARMKAYELAKRARELSRPSVAMDKEARAELYETVAQLMEMKRHYGEWLDEGAERAVEEGYGLAAARAWEVRTHLLGDGGEEKAAAPAAADAAPALKPFTLHPSPHAAKLREDMENNKSGWGQNDLHALYTGYGFVLREGGKHRFYSHPVFPDLTQSVSRQNDLPPGYAQSALKLIAQLESRAEAWKAAAAAAPAAKTAGPPAALSLEDLSILLAKPAEKAEEPVAARAPAERAQAAPARVKPAKPAPPVAAPVRANPAPLRPAEPVAREERPEPPAAPPEAPRKGVLERLRELARRVRSGGPN